MFQRYRSSINFYWKSFSYLAMNILHGATVYLSTLSLRTVSYMHQRIDVHYLSQTNTKAECTTVRVQSGMIANKKKTSKYGEPLMLTIKILFVKQYWFAFKYILCFAIEQAHQLKARPQRSVFSISFYFKLFPISNLLTSPPFIFTCICFFPNLAPFESYS